MSKVWIVATVVALAAGAAAGYVVLKARVPDMAPAGPNRDLAPESLACYAEVADGAGLWKKMSGTEAWGDLAASKMAATVLEAGPVKDFLAALDQVAAKAKYKIDATNAMKLVGREFSVGVKLDPAGGVPHVLVLTKLDTAALSKDLLSGSTDLDALWTELQKRTGSLEFKVTSSEHRDHKMATATRGDASYHAALLGDTLAVATDAALVRAAIDCRADGGAKSIGRRAEFQADMKALPPGASVVEWYDLDALDAGRASLDAGLARFHDNAAVTGVVHAILDGTKGAHSVGRATVLPDGDLYRLSWAYSKGNDLFADRASPAIASLLPGDWAGYVEFRRIGAVADAWKRSSLRKNLAEGEFGKWLDGVMDDPAKSLADATKKLDGLPFSRGMRNFDEDEPVPAGSDPAAMVDALGDRFSMKMGRHLLEQWLSGMTKGEAALAADAGSGPGESPRIALVVRLDIEGRLLALAAQGALRGLEGSRIKSDAMGSRQVWSRAGKGDTHWAFVGDTLVVSSDGDLVRAAAKSDGSAPPAGRIADAIAKSKPGWCAFVAYDTGRFFRGLSATTGQPVGTEPAIQQILDLYREAGVYGDWGEVAVYVPDDFASIEMRSRLVLSKATTEDGRMLRAESADAREPRCWASLPDSTIVHGAASAAGVRTLLVFARGVASIAGADSNAITSGFRDAVGMDLEKEFLPALGREIFGAVTFTPVPPPASDSDPQNGPGNRAPLATEPSTPIPGLVVGIEVKNADVVRKALDRALEMAEKSMLESPGGPGESPFTREDHQGVEIVRLELPGGQMPVAMSPACAVHDGFLLIALDHATLRTFIDVSKGKAPRLTDTPLFAAATGDLPRKCATFSLLDWNRLADQVAAYAPLLGGLVSAVDVPFPDFPEDGDQAEWKRRTEEYEKKMLAGRGQGEATVRRWIDAFRVIEYVGGTNTAAEDVSETTTIVRFKK